MLGSDDWTTGKDSKTYAQTANMELSMSIDDLYGSVGEPAITRLVAAFYAQVPCDDILGPMYPAADLPGAEQRLRDFLIFRSGGPQSLTRAAPSFRNRLSISSGALTAVAREGRWERSREDSEGKCSPGSAGKHWREHRQTSFRF